MKSMIIFISYVIIGIIITLMNWKKFHEAKYEEAKKEREVENGMVMIYMTITTVLWPITLINYIKKSIKQKRQINT